MSQSSKQAVKPYYIAGFGPAVVVVEGKEAAVMILFFFFQEPGVKSKGGQM